MPYEREYLMAQMANGSYDNPPRAIAGWQVVDRMDDRNTGFTACAYKNPNTGEVVIAYRGSDERKDYTGADFAVLGTTKWHPQFTQGLEFADRVMKANPSSTFATTGHSLGGSLAQVTSQMYGLKGTTFDPGGAANLVEAQAFKDWATTHGLPQSGRGAPSNFDSYIVNKSLVSNQSGAHVGDTHPVSGQEGRSSLEYHATQAAKSHGSNAVKAAAHANDQKQRHSMDRIETTFGHAVRDGKLNIIGLGDSDTKFAINEVPSRYVPLHAQVGEHINRLYTEKGIDWANGGDNTVASCTVKCVEQKVTDVEVASLGGGNIHLGQKVGYEWNVASVDAVQAARTPQQESFAQLAALDLQQSQKQDNPVQTQTKTQSGPSIG